MIQNLRQHHIGCLVPSIAEFKTENASIWNENSYSQAYNIRSQDVKVCFLNIASDTCIELVEPGEANKPLTRLLSKGISYYHVGFISHTYDESVANLLNCNWKQLTEFYSEAFNGKRCSFFYHPQLKLIELIEEG